MSSYAYDYQDLLCAPVPLQYFAEFCDVSLDTVKNWGRKGRGIPKSFSGVIFQAFNNLYSKNNSLQNDTKQKDIFFNKINDLDNIDTLTAVLENSGFPFFINDLREKSENLGNIGKSQSTTPLENALSQIHVEEKKKAKPENSPFLRSAFKYIKPYQPLRFFSAEKDKKIKILGAFDSKNPFFKGKKLHSATSRNVCEYIDTAGAIFKFQRKFISSMGGWRPTNEWLHVPSQDYLLEEKYALHESARHILPDSSVYHCQHSPISGDSVGILVSPSHDSARFFGLQNCKSVWTCPVCSAKISNKRANEVQVAYDKHKLQAGQFSFVTRTVPHTDADSLAYTLDRFIDAEKRLKQKRKYKDLKSLFGVIGSIKVYELTVTCNGWHLHVHEIYFHESLAAVLAAGGNDWLYEFEALMFPLWHDSAVASGFDSPSREHGLQVQDGDFAAAYITKYGKEPSDAFWNVNREMTKQHLKRSRKGLSPFDLLKQYKATGQQFYAELFKEFATNMHGRRQLMWSRGLKDYFGIEEKTDEELIEESEDDSFVLGYFAHHWREIRKQHLKARVLILARSGGFDAVKAYCLSIGLDFYTPDEFKNLEIQF